MTRSKFIRTLRIVATIGVILLVAAYAGWRSLPYARGPVITVFEPVAGSTISSSTAVVIGRAERINSLALNGHPLSVDEEDNFRDVIVIFPGLNVITLSASDQFGRSISKEIRIWGGDAYGL